MLEAIARAKAPHKTHFDPNSDDPSLLIQQQIQLSSTIPSPSNSTTQPIEGLSLSTLKTPLKKVSVVDQAVLEEIKKTITKLLAYAKKHPKSVAIWTEIAQLKDKLKIESTSNNSDLLLKLSVASDGAKSKASSVDTIDVMHSYIEKTAQAEHNTHSRASASDANSLQAALITSKAV